MSLLLAPPPPPVLRAHGGDSPASAASCPSGRCASSLTWPLPCSSASLEDGASGAKAAVSWGYVSAPKEAKRGQPEGAGHSLRHPQTKDSGASVTGPPCRRRRAAGSFIHSHIHQVFLWGLVWARLGDTMVVASKEARSLPSENPVPSEFYHRLGGPVL